MRKLGKRAREALRQHQMFNALEVLGFRWSEIEQLRRISMQLHRWHELECGSDSGAIERDETTGKTFWIDTFSGRRYPTPDRETGARKRLDAIMERHPNMRAYVQGDPRGTALYILRPNDAPIGQEDRYYSRGIAVY